MLRILSAQWISYLTDSIVFSTLHLSLHMSPSQGSRTSNLHEIFGIRVVRIQLVAQISAFSVKILCDGLREFRPKVVYSTGLSILVRHCHPLNAYRYLLIVAQVSRPAIAYGQLLPQVSYPVIVHRQSHWFSNIFIQCDANEIIHGR